MNIILYSAIPFRKDQNKIFEDMPSLLSANAIVFASYLDTQKISMGMTISFSVSASEEKAYSDYPIYASIEENNTHYYYFVNHVSRLAGNTISLDCEMDTLNTFSNEVIGGLTDKTLVKREHRDRFSYAHSSSWPKNQAVSAIVDDTSEGMLPQKWRGLVTPISTSIAGLENEHFYLIYKTRDDIVDEVSANPISVSLCADNPIKIANGSTGSVIDYSAGNLTTGVYYYADYMDAPNYVINFRQGSSTLYTATGSANVFVVFWKNLDHPNSIDFVIYSSDSYGNISVAYSYIGQNTIDNVYFAVTQKLKTLTFRTNQLITIEGGSSIVLNSGTTGDVYVQAFSSVDRTDSKLVKIIKLPYSPVPISYAGGVYSFPYQWSLQNGLMRLFDSAFASEFSNGDFPSITRTTGLAFSYASSLSARLMSKGTIANDPKLWHSDFHTEKFAYDSFSVEYPLEKVKVNSGVNPVFAFVFKQTNTINSNTLFKITIGATSVSLSQDFGEYLISTRNNEEPIFNNAYINYMRNGYNYDKKAKALSNTARWVGAVASVGGGALSAGIGSATGNPVTAGAGVTMITSGVAQITSAITSSISDENAMESKLASLSQQSTSVTGSDDIDLLTYYSNDKLINFQYDVSPTIKAMLNQLFFYYGYATNVQKAPDLVSRCHFNFIQCEADYDSDSMQILGNYLDDIKQKMAVGVTIFHFNADEVGYYDLDQSEENWEVGLAY